MNDLYSDTLITRYRSPRFRGVLDQHDVSIEGENPLCGDRIRVYLRFGPDGRVAEASFSGHGCAVAEASADVLMESLLGRSPEAALTLGQGDVLEALGLDSLPASRSKCACLPIQAVHKGILEAHGSPRCGEAGLL